MNTFISMLRGINVSGQKKIKMAELRNLYESLGLANVQSYLQSGNVLFNSPEPDAENLAKSIESRIEETFGYAVPVLNRSVLEFQQVIDSNPFLNDRSEDPARLYVTFLVNPPPLLNLSKLDV